MSTIQLCVVFISLFLTSVIALDYVFTLQEEGATACPGNEHLFLDTYFDLSNIDWKQLDDETIILQGYIIFLKELGTNLHLHIEIKKFSSGRWIETAFEIDRPDVCATLFDKYEIWYDFLKEFEANSELCPPNPGAKFDFNAKKLSTVLRDLTTGMEGTYQGLFKVFVAEKIAFCMVLEGYLCSKNSSSDDEM